MMMVGAPSLTCFFPEVAGDSRPVMENVPGGLWAPVASAEQTAAGRDWLVASQVPTPTTAAIWAGIVCEV